MIRAKPFLKWAGGKGQLIASIQDSLPEDFSEKKELCYIEPFAGSGAILFWVLENFAHVKKAIINDINSDLTDAYRIVKENPEELIRLLKDLQQEYYRLKTKNDRKSLYLEKRKEYNLRSSNKIISSGLLIFLNRTCYNGLYRVNSRNEFNVPFGDYSNPGICDADTIRSCSELLQRVTILNDDFSATLKYADENTFYYFDPPYKPLSRTSSFISYSTGNFGDREQKRLAAFCKKLHGNKSKWLLSNSDPKNTKSDESFFDNLYKGFHIKRVKARRNINSVSSKRGHINELLISNYAMQDNNYNRLSLKV
jgi:DNA adenine methylase